MLFKFEAPNIKNKKNRDIWHPVTNENGISMYVLEGVKQDKKYIKERERKKNRKKKEEIEAVRDWAG